MTKRQTGKRWLRKLAPAVPVVCIALAFAVVMSGDYAMATTLVGAEGTFDQGGSNSAQVTVQPVNKTCIPGTCQPKLFTVTYDPTSGTVTVTTAGSTAPTVTTSSNSEDANHSPAVTVSSDTSGATTSATAGGTTTISVSGASATTTGMIAVEQVHVDESNGEDPAGISGTVAINIVYLISCATSGDCEYTIDLVIDFDETGQPDNAYTK